MATMSSNAVAFSTATLTGPDGSAPMYGPRAWFCWNGSTQSLYGSQGVSSVTYNSGGNLTMNFSTALSNSNFCVLAQCTLNNGSPFDSYSYDGSYSTARTTSSVNLGFGKWFGTGTNNVPYNSACVFGN